jgi:hypothetical protein
MPAHDDGEYWQLVLIRHCEEQSDEAIQFARAAHPIWIASRSLSSGGASRRPVGSQ